MNQYPFVDYYALQRIVMEAGGNDVVLKKLRRMVNTLNSVNGSRYKRIGVHEDFFEWLEKTAFEYANVPVSNLYGHHSHITVWGQEYISLPRNCEVWSTDDGKRKIELLDLINAGPRRFIGKLDLTIKVKVRFSTKEDDTYADKSWLGKDIFDTNRLAIRMEERLALTIERPYPFTTIFGV